MTVKDLETLFDYGYWANRKLFATISQVTPEQFVEPISDNHGSIRNSMVHMLSAEWGWLGRCGGPERGAPLNPDDYPTVAALIEKWHQVEAWVRSFLSTLKNEDLARQVEFSFPGSEKYSMPLAELMHHAANHGVHHRGQVSLRLRLLGYKPDEFDILFYYAEKAGRRTS